MRLEMPTAFGELTRRESVRGAPPTAFFATWEDFHMHN